MKEIKTGDAYYRGLGLKKFVAWISAETENKYEKKRLKIIKQTKHRLSKIDFRNQHVTKHAPKG